MIVLGIDTASVLGGVALLAGSEPPRTRDLGERGRHAESLIPAAEALLREAGIRWEDVGLVAVAVGPGSFTGIRVGVAAALGLGAARQAPVAGVGCLDILARACYHAKSPAIGGYIVSAADVRRGEVALATYRVGGEGPVRVDEERLVAVSEPGPHPTGDVMLCGDGAAFLWPEAPWPRYRPAGSERAAATARLGREQGQRGVLEEPVPRYARAADARPRRS